MTHEKFANGSLVTYRVRDGFVPRTPDQLDAIAARHGMPASLVPAYAGDRAMVGKAISGQSGKARAAGWLVQPLTQTRGKVVYTIARIDKDPERERTDYTHDDVVKWDAAWDPRHIEGSHSVARAMDNAYQDLRGMVLASDWTQHIIDYIKGPCRGVAFLEMGGMYWVPPQGTAQLQALRAMLDAVGIGLVIGEIAPESHADVQEVAQAGLNDQLKALQDDVDAFDGSQPASVYRNRLDRLRELRATALMYDAAIGVKLDEVRGVLGQIDTKVRELLSVRVNTVIHKNGTRETIERPSVEAQLAALARIAQLDEPGRAQALLDGEIVLDCDAHDVAMLALDTPPTPDQAIIEALEDMPDLDPELAAMLAEPAPLRDLPSTW